MATQPKDEVKPSKSLVNFLKGMVPEYNPIEQWGKIQGEGDEVRKPIQGKAKETR